MGGWVAAVVAQADRQRRRWQTGSGGGDTGRRAGSVAAEARAGGIYLVLACGIYSLAFG
jgi:hypothetical protein